VLPFDLLFDLIAESGGSSMNRIARFARIGKLQKLIKITRMTRVVRIAKIQNKFVKSIVEMLKINAAFERLTLLSLVFLVLVHVVSCLW
jgi:hypothetical protein